MTRFCTSLADSFAFAASTAAVDHPGIAVADRLGADPLKHHHARLRLGRAPRPPRCCRSGCSTAGPSPRPRSSACCSIRLLRTALRAPRVLPGTARLLPLADRLRLLTDHARRHVRGYTLGPRPSAAG